MVMVYKISIVTMAKPLFTINTNRTDCYSISCSSSSSDLSFNYRSSMCQKRSTTKAILCANGRTGKEWKKLLLYLRTHLGQHRNVTFFSNFVDPKNSFLINGKLLREDLLNVWPDRRMYEERIKSKDYSSSSRGRTLILPYEVPTDSVHKKTLWNHFGTGYQFIILVIFTIQEFCILV
ncbi:hypothetical protein MKX03_031963 [Papaver bracteatum]|nr:hypothetical protein MKX03_031963 [Papaver bracteatum]